MNSESIKVHYLLLLSRYIWWWIIIPGRITRPVVSFSILTCLVYLICITVVLLGSSFFTPLSTIVQSYRGGQFYRSTVENDWPVASHRQTVSHSVVSSTPRLGRFELTTLLGICTDCISSCTSNYLMTTTTTAPESLKLHRWIGGILIITFYNYMHITL